MKEEQVRQIVREELFNHTCRECGRVARNPKYVKHIHAVGPDQVFHQPFCNDCKPPYDEVRMLFNGGYKCYANRVEVPEGGETY